MNTQRAIVRERGGATRTAAVAVAMEESSVEAEVVRVTPAMAKEWLGTDYLNRDYQENVASRWAREISAGEWQLNGQPIIFDADGSLLDGQHRLGGVIKADRAVDMLVVRGIDRRARPTIDKGSPRSSADEFAMNGEEDSKALAAGLQAYHNIIAGTSSGRAKLAQRELDSLLESHPRMRSSVRFYKHLKNKTQGILGPATARALHCRFSELVDVEEANNFISVILTGIGATPETWEGSIRLRLQAAVTSQSRSIRLTGLEKRELVIKAWNRKRQGLPVGGIKKVRTGKGTKRAIPE
jgi:hypothetical protein